MCTRSNFFKNEPSISLDNAELFLETSKESWDDLIEAYVCPICQELILADAEIIFLAGIYFGGWRNRFKNGVH